MLDQAGWPDARKEMIAGDASGRRYARLTRPDGSTSILMDAPSDLGQDVRPFVNVARYLNDQGLSAPDILAEDAEAGFLLLEDLGDALFARMAETKPDLESDLYTHAVDVLLHLHKAPLIDLPVFDADVMADLSATIYSAYGLGTLGNVDTTAQTALRSALHSALSPLNTVSRVVMLRDYHAENLLWLPDRTGIARVGLLDFQDATLAHPAYDLVSVLQDARRDVPKAIEADMKARYIALSGFDPVDFECAYALLGAQRHLRILFIFARLSLKFGRPHYVDLIPRTWNHLQRSLAAEICAPVREIVQETLPAPTPDLLASLKAQCGQQPHL